MRDFVDEAQIRKLFMLLHGMYGNAVLDRYRIGQTGDNGEDVGMAAARTVWQQGLREFTPALLLKALGKCADKHRTFPPTLPEFLDICKSLSPRQWSAPHDVPRLEMSEALRSEQVERTRRAIAAARLRREGGINSGEGLKSLHVLIAKAVGHAGGDEASTLLRLDGNL